ncbi:MAG: hypothetical protein IJ743_05460 [Bacilli bacterium]|nr:hypothetical protein [Bacilli bacterium]
MKQRLNYKKKMIYFGIIGVLLLIGVSYAIWQLNFTQESANVLSTACFSVSYTEQDNISLLNTYSMLDSEGSTLTPYQVTIKNNCNEYGAYQVNLEVLNTSTLDSAFVKIMFDEQEPKLLNSYTAVEKTLSDATSAYKMTKGFLNPNEEKTYTLRLWIDENVSLEDHVEGKRFSSKITIVNTYKASAPTSIEECELIYGEGASICNINAFIDPENEKCLKVDENGMILNPYSTMSDEDTPIVCTMEDDYGTSYYYRGNHQDNNVKFANMCWKLIRITGTGGYKLLYNGDLDSNGKCSTTAGDHIGFRGDVMYLSGNNVYGTSYTKEGSTYTLVNTSTIDFSTDSASTIGKYTCGNTSTSCTSIYVVLGEYTSNYGQVIKLEQSTNYATIGVSAFNYQGVGDYTGEIRPSAALVGYMYNEQYPERVKELSGDTKSYYYGASFTYSGGVYTLNNTMRYALNYGGVLNANRFSQNHYTCFNNVDNTCSEMYYIYRVNSSDMFYIELNENETGPQALAKMLSNDSSTAKNSLIKSAIDWWYEQNIKNTEYESQLEDTIFCNDRTIDDVGAWSETGALESLKFNAYNSKYYLKCPNKKDAFTVNNKTSGNGSLQYPIGLLTTAEHSLIGNYASNKIGQYYWTLSSSEFGGDANIMEIGSSGDWQNAVWINNPEGVRPSISLKPGIEFKEGTDGSAANPYEVVME